MKKTGVINSEISATVALMGHTDTIAVVDAGFPISSKTKRIDLAVSNGIPGFLEVLENIFIELHAEEMILAAEITEKNPRLEEILKEKYPGIKFTYIPHEELKARSEKCRAIIRTGEFTPYANIILRSGVVF